ncbi:MAG: DEAD/DEAH box helicase [Clostridia bacterium]|nr:DEAD/DEAH box helicase [Clostridia bacterium]
MKYQPHDYQEYATRFIVEHPVAAVFLQMGLGKSVITLTAIQELALERFEVCRVLVIAPLRVARDTWPSEIQKWDHLHGLTYSVAVGTEAQRIAALKKNTLIHIINRENVQWLIEQSGLPFHYDMVVIDELSSFKSYQAKRFRALMKVRPKVSRIVGLTGTPSSNGLMDLWAEFRLLDMGRRLGKFVTHYREEFFLPDRRSAQQVFTWKPKAGSENEIYRRISDITISMKSADFLQMPEYISNRVPVSLSPAERKTYDKLKQELVISLQGAEIDAVNAASLSGKLCQLANGGIYDAEHNSLFFHERKLDALEDIIEAANGQSVLVAYWFKHDLERIRERFVVREIRTSRDIADWNSGKIPVACIHPASAGHGLNLQAGGNTLVWFGLTWSLELYQQTNARLWRQGQKADTVVVHHIVTTNTIDEQILAALERKDTTQTALMNAVKAQLEV